MIAQQQTTKLAIEALQRSDRELKSSKFKNNSGYSSYLLRAQNRRIKKQLEQMQDESG